MESFVREQFPMKGKIDPSVYRAAVSPDQCIEASKLEAFLYHITPGKQNTLLHLAAAVGNLLVVQQLLRHPKLKPEFIEAINVNGNTALHEAAQGGHWEVVELLLSHHKILVNIQNSLGETALFKACEGGHPTAVEKLLAADPSSLRHKSLDGRTCLHAVVIKGNSDLLEDLRKYATNYLGDEKEILVKEKDQAGNTVLHLAVRKNRLDMVKHLLGFESELCYCLNDNEETPLSMAVKLGSLNVVKELINCKPDSIDIPSRDGKNVLHLAVEFSQVGIVKFLMQTIDLSQLINQHDSRDRKNENTKENNSIPSKEGGDTPLHIAARNKSLNMVDLLLDVRGVNKDAVNKAGLTPLDIARENTEYHDPYDIIEKLTDFPRWSRPFLHSAPNSSPQKYKKSVEILENAFSERRNTELVVAALLATMTFTAAFTVPGGFVTERDQHHVLGSPLLIGYDSMKLFLIFDCTAFFLSLFVVLIWEMSSPLTTEDKMLFMCITNAVVCSAFAFTAYGFMCAVYVMLAHKVKTLAWVILGFSLFIAVCGNMAYFYMAVKFTVKRARFHRLCGVPRLADETIECVWMRLENCGVLDCVRRCVQIGGSLHTGHGLVGPNHITAKAKGKTKTRAKAKSKAGGEGDDGSSSKSTPHPQLGHEPV